MIEPDTTSPTSKYLRFADRLKELKAILFEAYPEPELGDWPTVLENETCSWLEALDIVVDEFIEEEAVEALFVDEAT